jgi:alpha-tubulin suppressor-like RCC1 family protein
MKSKIITIVLSVVLFSQITFAQLCARLIDAHVGETHTLALSEDNTLFSCGSGPLGLGDGVSTALSLQRVKGLNGSGFLKNIIAFDAGWTHSLAVDANGACFSFGTEDVGQLGNGPNEGDTSVPIRVHGVNDVNFLTNIVAVSAGRSGKHSLAVRDDGYVVAWGRNDAGQCGNDDPYNNPQYPVIVLSTGEDPNYTYLGQEAFIVDVEAGIDHSLALERDDGIVYEWGSWQYYVPHKVQGPGGVGFLRNIVDIATCGYSLAADSNGNVWRWTTGSAPTRVPGGDMGTEYLEHIVKVAAGNGVYAAIDSNGNVWELQSWHPVKVTDGQQNSTTGYLEDIVALIWGGYSFNIMTFCKFHHSVLAVVVVQMVI